jgi:hypothetical protein
VGNDKGSRVASGWLYNPLGAFFASVDTQPAHGNRGWQVIDPGFRLPPTNICDHFLRKAPFCWALSKRHLILIIRSNGGRLYLSRSKFFMSR